MIATWNTRQFWPCMGLSGLPRTFISCVGWNLLAETWLKLRTVLKLFQDVSTFFTFSGSVRILIGYICSTTTNHHETWEKNTRIPGFLLYWISLQPERYEVWTEKVQTWRFLSIRTCILPCTLHIKWLEYFQVLSAAMEVNTYTSLAYLVAYPFYSLNVHRSFLTLEWKKQKGPLHYICYHGLYRAGNVTWMNTWHQWSRINWKKSHIVFQLIMHKLKHAWPHHSILLFSHQWWDE